MYKIYENDIALTRGDTLEAVIDLTKDGEPYIPGSGDVITFKLKRKKFISDQSEYADAEPLLKIVVPNETLLLSIPSSATEELGFGFYDYYIDITMGDGTVDTFVSGDFILTPKA